MYPVNKGGGIQPQGTILPKQLGPIPWPCHQVACPGLLIYLARGKGHLTLPQVPPYYSMKNTQCVHWLDLDMGRVRHGRPLVEQAQWAGHWCSACQQSSLTPCLAEKDRPPPRFYS